MRLSIVLGSSFARLGLLIHDFWYIFFLLPIGLTFLLSIGVMRLQELSLETIDVYIPDTARAHDERRILKENWPVSPTRFQPLTQGYMVENYLEVIATPHADGDFMDKELIDEIVELLDFVTTNISVSNPESRSLTFPDLCLSERGRCVESSHLGLLQISHEFDGELHLKYPVSLYSNSPIYVASTFGGVTTSKDGQIKSIKAVRMFLYLNNNPPFIDKMSKDWLRKAADHLLDHKGAVRVSAFYPRAFNTEMDRTVASLVPRFCITFGLLLFFSMMCCLTLRRCKSIYCPVTIDWSLSKPQIGLAGIVSSCLAICSGFGLMLITAAVPYNSIVCVTPFLAISIGIDDTFILLAAWSRSHGAVRDRMSATMRDAAVTITITSVTDFLSFAIGAITAVPGVRIFCAYTACVIAFTYLYQLSFFMASLSLCHRKQQRMEKKIATLPPPDLVMAYVDQTQPKPKVDIEEPAIKENLNLFNYFFSKLYAPVIFHPVFSLVAVLWAFFYITASIYGVLHIKEGLEPKNLFPSNSRYRAIFDDNNAFFYQEGEQVLVVINNPPRLNFPKTRTRIFGLVAAFESTEYTMAQNATMFWLHHYAFYLQRIGYNLSSTEVDTSDRIWHHQARHWLMDGEGKRSFKGDVIWSDKVRPQRMMFRVGLKNFLKPNDHRQAAQQLRAIADRYPRFNVTTFHPFWPFADQYAIIGTNTMQNVVISIACMTAVIVLFLPNALVASVVVLSIVSIDLGVLGFMTWWNISLDAISMICIIMSVGFAVDLSAHVPYAFSVAQGTPLERGTAALTEIGAPLLQAAVSTMLGVLALSTVEAYMVVTFFKTLLLVMLCGLLHGLLFLPILLVYSTALYENFKRIERTRL